MVRAISEPLGYAELRVYLTGRHGNARLLTGGNDFLQTQLAVAENGDESNKHADLRFNEGRLLWTAGKTACAIKASILSPARIAQASRNNGKICVEIDGALRQRRSPEESPRASRRCDKRAPHFVIAQRARLALR